MASLKDINATIEEGNEDLEKLNRNFTKWFESQKKSGDDLEAAKEARMKRNKGSGGVVKAAATGAVVSKGMDFPLNKMLIGAGLLGLGAALIAAFREEIADFFNRLLRGLPKIPTGEGQDFANEIGFGAKATSNAFRRFNQRQKNLATAEAERRRIRNMQKNYSQARGMGDAERRAQRQRFLEERANTRGNRPRYGGMTERSSRISSMGDEPDRFNKNRPRVRYNLKLQRFQNVNTGQIVSNAEGARLAKEYRNSRAATTKNASNVNFKRSKFGNAFRTTTSLVSSANSKLGDAFRQYNERVGGGTRAGLPNPNTWRGTTVAFGDAVVNFFKRLPIVGSFGRFIFKTLLHPKVLRFVGNKLIIIELLALWFDHAIDYSSLIPGGEPQPVIRKLKTPYTAAEKIAGTVMLLGAVYTSMIGATIGGIIGTMTLGALGTISGGLLGMYLGFQAPGKMLEILQAFAEKNDIFDKELASFRDKRKAQQKANANEFAQANLGTNAGANATVAGKQNFESGFVGGAMLSSQGAGDGKALSATLESNSSQNLLAGNRMFGAISAKAITGADRAKYLASGNHRNLGIVKRSFGSIMSGVNALGNMIFGTPAEAAGFSTPAVSSPLVGMSADQLMNGPEAGRGPVSSFIDAKSTNMTAVTNVNGGNGVTTIDKYILQPGFNISHSMYTGSSRGQYN